MVLGSPEIVIQPTTNRKLGNTGKPKQKLEFSLKWSKKTKSRPKVEFSPIIEKSKSIEETMRGTRTPSPRARTPSPRRPPTPKQGEV